MKRLIIAIDGPAASGKSTTAKLVASRLGYLHVDTGAMYRAMTLKVLEKGIDPQDAKAVALVARTTRIRLAPKDGGSRVELDGVDVSEKIRTPAVTKTASAVSMVPEVRQSWSRNKGKWESRGRCAGGRDIGTVVFPNADVKIFMLAHPRERAVRRSKELARKEIRRKLMYWTHFAVDWSDAGVMSTCVWSGMTTKPWS